MDSEPNPVDAFVMKTESGYVVRPAQVALDRGQPLRVHNFTQGELTVYLPSAEGAAPRPADCAVPAGGYEDYSVSSLGRGPHAYAVFSAEAGYFCAGESTPHIIIKN